MILTDTILALSSPATGSGLRAILRLSGPDAHRLAAELVEIDATDSRRYLPNLNLRHWPANNRLASVLRFHAPKSFTGQDITELHLPNSPGLVRWTIDHLLQAARTLNLPARMADPGEFSARAFFNGKMDLTEAEGIAATINAQNETQLRAAASLREGDLHKKMDRLAESVASLLSLVEAGIDFSDEEGISLLPAEKAESALEQHGEGIDEMLSTSVRVDRIDTLPKVVFIGRPNVGKSSLINALTQSNRAMVSDVAGTTRDRLSAVMHCPGGDMELIDVPGEEIPSDILRSRMMDARAAALLDADLVVRVIDHREDPRRSSSGWTDIPSPLVIIQNKCDLLSPGQRLEGHWFPGTGKPWGLVSAQTCENIEKLRETLARYALRLEVQGVGRVALNQRHRLILQEVKTVLWDAAAAYTRDEVSFRRHPELLAAELRRALDLLGQITGTISPDEVLGRIFSTFCIGK